MKFVRMRNESCFLMYHLEFSREDARLLHWVKLKLAQGKAKGEAKLEICCLEVG